MPKRNRVDPFGELVVTSERGTLMGNRGCLHDASGRIKKAWARKAWVTCLLEYKDRHRQIMAPGKYTELFFLDEVTALAAGHRPCGTCQKGRYGAFKQFWLNANGAHLDLKGSSIQVIDGFLHQERQASSGGRKMSLSRLRNLPQGAFIVRQQAPETAWLYWGGRLFPWQASGYSRQEPVSGNESVQLLTPESIVRALREGFHPQVHASAEK